MYVDIIGRDEPLRLALVRFYKPDATARASREVVLTLHGYEHLEWTSGTSKVTSTVKKSYEIIELDNIIRQIYVCPNFNVTTARKGFAFFYDPHYWFGYVSGN